MQSQRVRQSPSETDLHEYDELSDEDSESRSQSTYDDSPRQNSSHSAMTLNFIFLFVSLFNLISIHISPLEAHIFHLITLHLLLSARPNNKRENYIAEDKEERQTDDRSKRSARKNKRN